MYSALDTSHHLHIVKHRPNIVRWWPVQERRGWEAVQADSSEWISRSTLLLKYFPSGSLHTTPMHVCLDPRPSQIWPAPHPAPPGPPQDQTSSGLVPFLLQTCTEINLHNFMIKTTYCSHNNNNDRNFGKLWKNACLLIWRASPPHGLFVLFPTEEEKPKPVLTFSCTGFYTDVVCSTASWRDTINPEGWAPPHQLEGAKTKPRPPPQLTGRGDGGPHPGDFLSNPDSWPLLMVLEGIQTAEGMEGGWWWGRGGRWWGEKKGGMKGGGGAMLDQGLVVLGSL